MTVSLAEELVSEILTLLPAKSLMRFKSVERSWNTLFNTNSFITRHRVKQMGSSSSSDEEERFMMFYTDPMQVFPRITLVYYDQLQLQDLQYPVTHPDHYMRRLLSLGHCNGIFCLQGFFNAISLDSSFDEIILWNPSTREVKVLPPNPLTPPTLNFFEYCGFGADTFDHFKFIQFYSNEDTVVVYAEVCNINTDSWTVIHDYDFDANGVINRRMYPLEDYGAYSNGVCHWLSADYTYILCFDFHCNKFWKINTPSTMSSPSTISYSTILEAHDCIAYLVYDTCDRVTARVGIWNLKQDSSWVKLCNVEPLNSFIRIHAIWKDGTEFLGGSQYQDLALYNSRAQPLRQIEICAEEYEFHIYPYVESIAPLSL